MGYKKDIPSKVIKITDNKKKILKMLDQALESCGFKTEAAKPAISSLVPSVSEPLEGALNKIKSTIEDRTFFTLTGKGKTLTAINAEFDDEGDRLLQEYINDWIDIENKAGFTSSDMESPVIDSARILAMEIFVRIVIQILRIDNNAPLETKLTRSSWIKVLEEFCDKFYHAENILDLNEKEKKAFLISIEELHGKWIYWLKCSVENRDEIEKAKSTVNENLHYIKKRELQIMRYIAIELTDKKDSNSVHHGCLADRQIPKHLENLQLNLIDRMTREGKKFDKRTDVLLMDHASYRRCNIENTNWINKKEIDMQNAILQLIDNEHIKKYYGLLNWTRLVIRMVEKIDEIIKLGNWVPILLNTMELGKVDQLLASHQLIYRELINSKNLPEKIDNSKLRMELCRYNLRDASRDVRSLPAMRDLQNKELLARISDRLCDAFFNISALGGLLGCHVVSSDFALKEVSSHPSIEVSAPKKSNSKFPTLFSSKKDKESQHEVEFQESTSALIDKAYAKLEALEKTIQLSMNKSTY